MDAKVSEWRPGPNVCRCCFTEGCYKDISTEYFWMGKREVYAEMLSETFDLTIAYSKSGGPNSNSRLICENCIARLRDATDFKRQVKECEKTFIQHLDPGNNATTEIELRLEADHDKTVKLESVKLEKRHSDDDFDDRNDFATTLDDDDDDLDDQPLLKLASKTPKKETENVDILDLLDNAKVTEKRKSSTKSKEPPTKKLKKKEPLPKSSASKSLTTEKKKKGKDTRSETSLKPETVQREEKIVPLFQVAYDRTLCRPLGTLVDFNRLTPKLKEFLKRIEVKDEYPTNVLHSPSRSVSPLSPLPSATVNGPVVKDATKSKPKSSAPKIPDLRQNALTVFEFSTVYPFVYGNNKFKCFICSQPFLETPPLKEHMNSTHTFAPLKRLINNRRETVIKVDVSSIICKICTTPFKDLTSLKVHLKDVHEKPLDAEVKDNMIPFKLDEGLYKCFLCDQVFIKVRLLVIHMSVHFSNYSCDVCGSGFMTLRLLKKHLEVHESGNFPCDRCEKVFNTSHKRSLHIRGVHLKQCPRRCPICPERFNSNYRRTIHLQDVHNQSTRVHKCDICGRGFNLKYHLISHTRAVHLQERNQQCKLCLQRFCSKETLKRHMVIHTGEKNYKCEVCGMAFLRRKNLKDHMRLHDVA